MPNRTYTRTEEYKRKMSEACKNKPPDSLVTRQKKSEAIKCRWQNPKFRERMSKIHKQRYQDHPEARRKIAEASKRMWQNPVLRENVSERVKRYWADPKNKRRMSDKRKKLWQDPIFRERTRKAQREAMNTKPTKPEKKFIEIIEKHNLPYRYTGAGEVWIGNRNPDFIEVNGKKAVVEIFGSYYHSPLVNPKMLPIQTYSKTMADYKRYGFECHVFWEHDIMSENAEQIVLKELKDV